MAMINRVPNHMTSMYMYNVAFTIKFALCKINTEYMVHLKKFIFANLNQTNWTVTLTVNVTLYQIQHVRYATETGFSSKYEFEIHVPVALVWH